MIFLHWFSTTVHIPSCRNQEINPLSGSWDPQASQLCLSLQVKAQRGWFPAWGKSAINIRDECRSRLRGRADRRRNCWKNRGGIIPHRPPPALVACVLALTRFKAPYRCILQNGCRAMRSNKLTTLLSSQKYSQGSYRKLQERYVVKFRGQTNCGFFHSSAGRRRAECISKPR